jgi:hypothetical protein
LHFSEGEGKKSLPLRFYGIGIHLHNPLPIKHFHNTLHIPGNVVLPQKAERMRKLVCQGYHTEDV